MKFPTRGIMILSIGIVLAVSGAYLFDNSYSSVESIMSVKHKLIEDSTLLPNHSINSTISNDQLFDHNVLIAHVMPSSGSIKLIAIEPNHETFEKESKNGFVYHIMEKNSQSTGNYSIVIYNLGNEPVDINAVIGQDPYLSGKCNTSYGTNCYTIPMAIGFVIVGVVAFIVGALLVFTDLRKQRLRNK